MVENFTALYAIVFYATVIALASCELLPLNRQAVHLARRWPTNIGLFALNFVIMWICVPISAVEVAQRAGSGPLRLMPVDAGIGIILGVLILDLWKYSEHRLMHRFSPLWRFHLVHHSDTDVDFTTTERHHPIEVAFSSVVLLAVIFVLAVPPLAVVTFLLFGTIVTFASHANLRLPGRIDGMVRWLVVTPSVHVIHHSALRDETDSNYGVIFTVWDRLFGTYRERRADHEASVYVQGLEFFRAPRDARLDRVLWHPFAYRTTAHATTNPAAATARDDGRGDAAQQVRAGWANALLGIGLGLVVLVFAFQSTAMELVSIWSASTSYEYAWLVLPALAFLLWHHRQRFSADRPTWSLIGIAASAACGVAWLVFDLVNIGVGRQLALVAAIPCIVLSAVGVRVFARLAPSLTLLALLVPSGDFLLPPLKSLTVNIVAAAAALAHIPCSYDGQVIFVGANRYVIIDDCAGLPYLLTTLFLGLTFGLLMYRSAWKIGLFALLGIGCGIFANGVRVVSIVMLDWIQGTRMELSSHVLFQWVGFAFAITLMVAVLMSLASEPEEPAYCAQMGRGARAGGRSLFAALCAAALAVSIPRIALAHIDSGNQPAGSREIGAGDLLPERFAGWTKRTAATSWNPAPRTPIPYALARYARGDQEIEVFVAATERPTHKVTGYAIDLVGPGQWLEANRRLLSNCLFPRCEEVHALELDRQFSNDVRHVYYVYALGGRIIGTALELQLQRAWNGFIGAPQQTRIIAVASDGEAELRPADIAEALNALASG
jgi:exosortase